MVRSVVRHLREAAFKCEVPEPLWRGRRAKTLPDADADDWKWSEPREAAATAILLRYTDAHGQESLRRISVYDIEERPDGICLRAFCFERRAPRAFRVDRINDIADVETGEVMDNTAVVTMLRDMLDPQRLSTHMLTRRLLRMEAPALRVLLFLARCDGEMHRDEASIALRYLDHRSPTMGWRPDDAERMLTYMYPDQRGFLTGLFHLKRRPDAVKTLRRHVRQMVDVDGIVHLEEHEVVAEIDRYLAFE